MKSETSLIFGTTKNLIAAYHLKKPPKKTCNISFTPINYEAIRLLVMAGANVNLADRNGATLLSLVKIRNYGEATSSGFHL